MMSDPQGGSALVELRLILTRVSWCNVILDCGLEHREQGLDQRTKTARLIESG